MRFAGKLHEWNAQRGFGFIRPEQGGDDVFVHISSLPGGARPPQDEVLTFEVALDRAGRKKAVHVRLQRVEAAALEADRQRGAFRARRPPQAADDVPRADYRRSIGVPIIAVVLIALSTFSFQEFTRRRAESAGHEGAAAAPVIAPEPAAFACDGRRYCSEMRSCAEATFFLKQCPGTEMDGDRDGVPCEQQWCSGG